MVSRRYRSLSPTAVVTVRDNEFQETCLSVAFSYCLRCTFTSYHWRRSRRSAFTLRNWRLAVSDKWDECNYDSIWGHVEYSVVFTLIFAVFCCFLLRQLARWIWQVLHMRRQWKKHKNPILCEKAARSQRATNYTDETMLMTSVTNFVHIVRT